jgi:uncharacterized 2Fe-2S/4Fe-4S cluster protein (DUF4445 family)
MLRRPLEFIVTEADKTLCKVRFTGNGQAVAVPKGSTIAQAASKADISLYTACGGRGTCGKCAVVVQPGANQVLACQYHVTGDIDVDIPSASRQARHKILHEGIDQDVVICPVFHKVFLRLADEDPQTVIETLELAGGERQYHLSEHAAAALRKFSQSDLDRGVTAVCKLDPSADIEERYLLTALEHGDTTGLLYGVAVDIGTTTVVATLIDLNSADAVASASCLNPQNVFGDDVISRISHGHEDSGLAQLHEVTVAGLNDLIARCCKDSGVAEQSIYEVTVVGNTTMNHIFLGLPIKQLGHSPYNAWSVDAHDVRPAKLGLNINPAGNVHTVENIAGFVGADTVGVAVAVRMDQVEKMTLAIDIGTNGELILGTKERMFAASCAAGPAFEGARISQGSRAMHGAIERVAYSADSGDIDVRTIAGEPAVSLCGSGLIDAVGVMLELGIVDETGRLLSPDDVSGSLSAKVLARFTEKNGQPAFVIAWGTGGGDIVLTQKDLREVQLAKAAIRAGIRLLQARAGIDDSQIEQYLVAGAFGNYIDARHAMRIGLLPSVPLEKVKFVGNAAASGARLVLLNRHFRNLANTIARRIQYVEIGHEAEFSMIFADCLMF